MTADPQLVTAAAAAAMQEFAIVDVRTPAEFEWSHIPGSVNVPLDQLRDHAEALAAAAGAPMLFVCRSGARAHQAAGVLAGVGAVPPRVLDGGIAAWEAAGLAVNRGQQRWSMERQVRGVAGALVLVGALGGLLVGRPLGLLAAGVGGGLLFSAVTDTCAMASVLAKLPYNQGAGCDVAAALDALGARKGVLR